MAKKNLPLPISIANEVLKKFLKYPSPLRKDSASDWWKLRNTPNSFHSADKHDGDIVICPFPVKEELQDLLSLYPFFISINILLEPNEDIKEVNIRVLKEDDSRPTKADFKPTELLIRAEWCNHQNDNHAQPHWHIHSYTLIDQISFFQPDKRKTLIDLMKEEMIFESMNENLEVDETNDGEAPKESNRNELQMYKFHLSMLSNWDVENSKNECKELNVQTFERWLPQCLNYLKIQLEYLLEKFPRPF